MNDILLIIQKKRFWEDHRGRFVRFKTKDRAQMYVNAQIKTEAQLCYYLYQKYGAGYYMVLGFMKGKKGFWKYWYGELHENGFLRYKKKHRDDEFDSFEQEQMNEFDLRAELISNTPIKKKKRNWSGPVNLIQSKPTGIMHPYQEFEVSNE